MSDDNVHAEIEEQFSGYYDGELAEAESKRVAEHLASCTECKAAYDNFKTTVEAISGLSKVAAPVGFEKDVESTIEKRSAGRFFAGSKWSDRVPLTLLALLLILAGIGLTLWLRSSETGSLDRPEKETGSPVDEETRKALPQPEPEADR